MMNRCYIKLKRMQYESRLKEDEVSGEDKQFESSFDSEDATGGKSMVAKCINVHSIDLFIRFPFPLYLGLSFE